MHGDDFVPLRTFDWLIAIAASDLPDPVKVTAMTLPGRTGKGAGLTGARVQPMPEATALVRDLSARTVKRHIAELRGVDAAGAVTGPPYLERTRPAAPDHPAEYQLRGPARFQGAARKAQTGDDDTRSRVTRTRDSGTRQPVTRSADEPLPTGDRSGGQRVTRSGADVARPEQVEQQPPPGPIDLTRAPTRAPAVDDDVETVRRLVRERTGVALNTEAAAEIYSQLRHGWTPEQLADHLTEDLNGAHNVTAVILKRLRTLGTPLPTKPGRPPWCRQCDDRTRMVETDDGRPMRCPRCHPQAVTAIA